MAVAHKGAISFGLVYIPVNLHTATQNNDISFNQLHKADNARIRYKKVCSHCGKEVEAKDIVKGFEYEKGSYVTVSDDEIEKIKTQKDKAIQILQFCGLDEISPIYYDKAYYVVAEKGGAKPLELLRSAMMETQRVALGKSVFGSHEKLLIIIPREEGVLIQTLMFQDDIKDINLPSEKPPISKAELSMAKQLIEGLQSPFNPSEHSDEFQEKLKTLIQTKIEGKDIKKPKEAAPEKIVDLMEALKASVMQTAKKTTTAKKSNPKTKSTNDNQSKKLVAKSSGKKPPLK